MTEIGIDELARRLGDVPILDVRLRHEYDGSAGKPCDPRQGHIPGARHLELSRLMELDRDELVAAVGLEPGAELIAYCHGGSRSAIAVQILRSVGFDARNYEGSWHEWSRRDDLPLEARAR